jgi:Fic family protein
MILNHKAAIELLVESADEVGVNRYTVTNLHSLLADNLLDDPRNAGRLRTTPIAIGASTYIPTAIPQLIEELFGQLLDKAAAIRDPFEQSLFLMVQLPCLQPFVDVNKRTSRLAANIPLIKANLVPLSVHRSFRN